MTIYKDGVSVKERDLKQQPKLNANKLPDGAYDFYYSKVVTPIPSVTHSKLKMGREVVFMKIKDRVEGQN